MGCMGGGKWSAGKRVAHCACEGGAIMPIPPRGGVEGAIPSMCEEEGPLLNLGTPAAAWEKRC